MMGKIGRSKIAILETKMTTRLKGLYRINSDLISIEEMVQATLSENKNKKYFNDYQGIIITYRKCFMNGNRVAELTDKHLAKASDEQIGLHQRLLDLGNRHVAHGEKEEYDSVEIGLIIENASGLAVDIDVTQTLYEPLSYSDYKDILGLILILKNSLVKDIRILQHKLINEYNSKNPLKAMDSEISI